MVDPPPAYRVLGVRIHAVTVEDMHARIAAAVGSRQRFVAVSQNLHSVYLVSRDERIRWLQERADVVRVDGMPLVWASRLFGYPVLRRHRTGWMDWIERFCDEASQRSWRVFYLGSRPGVAERGAERLRARHPGLELTTHHGYFDATPGSADDTAVLSSIRAYDPDVLLVGMGMPRQETWIRERFEALPAPAVLTCGAAIDYVAGEARLPPRWLGAIGLEWAYRLANEPRRLGRRYMVEPWSVITILARDVLSRARGQGPYRFS